MGKKMKPKARNPRKPQSRSNPPSPNPNPNPNPSSPSSPQQEETETKSSCTHYTKGNSHLNKTLLSILSSTDPFSCDHCRDDLPSSNPKKGGAKKKTAKSGPKKEPIWVCLDCGRSFCGGAVSEAVPYGHARRHAKQEKHQWAVGTESAGTAWCFACDCEVPIEMPNLEETAPASSAKSSSEPDYRIGKSDSKSDSKSESNFQIGNHHIIRGLSNLGNTCFFNSVLQNLLALKALRESLFPPQNPNSDPTNPNSPPRVSVTGPLTSSLKKIFIETSLSDEYKGTLSPKNLFSNICAKAPQFRGFQQQDSHELLRYLLDGLHTEEISARKSKQEEIPSDSVPVKPVKLVPTLVDSVFGGLLSSTVSCMDCGFTSVVHEPFLDLSLPVPAKKSNNSTVTNRKTGTNRPTVVRGRGRVQRLKTRTVTGTKSSPVEEKEKLEASSSKDETEGEMKSGTDSKAEGQEESAESGVNGIEGVQESSAVSEADEGSFSWLDFVEPAWKGESGTVSEAICEEKVGDNAGESDGTDSAVLKATRGCDIISTDDKSDNQLDGTDLDAKAGTEPDSTDLDANHARPERDSTVVEADVETEPDGTDLNAKVDDGRNESSCSTVHDAKADDVAGTSVRDESDCTVLDANEKEQAIESTVLNVNEKEQAIESAVSEANEKEQAIESTVLNVNEKEQTIESAVLNANEKEQAIESAVLDANEKESDSTVLDANATEPEPQNNLHDASPKQPESSVFEASPKETESTDLDAGPKEPGSEIPVSDSESWLLDDNNTGSDPKPASQPDPSTDDSSTLATDMGFPTAMGPAPNPNPNPKPNPKNPSAEDDETDIFGSMFDEPESEPVKPASQEDENDDSIFWGITHSLNGFGFSQQEVDDETLDPVSVASCLGLFTKTEILTGEHAWRCEKCEEREGRREKGRRDAVKRFLVDKAPRVLTVHLKRFGQDLRGRLSKLRGHVGFEEVLDLKPYFDPRSKERERFEYRLVGVVEHSGSMSGGHYVAYVRGERKSKDGAHCQTWFYASDAQVREVPLHQVLKSEAYLLFYERIED